MLNVLLAEMDSIREGDKTLLDRMLIFNYTDSGYAKNHTTDNIPMLTAGGAGGRMKTGVHFARRQGRLRDAPFADDPASLRRSDLELRNRIEQHLEDHYRGDGVTVARTISMKSGARGWTGAAGVALLAAIGAHWLAHREKPADATTPAPLATPFGITLQLRTVAGRARRAANPPVYADANSMTLYFFDEDKPFGKSKCSGECAAMWPPATAPQGRDSRPAIGRSRLAPTGTKQWAYRGAPLYRFAQDEAIGDAKGDGTPRLARRSISSPEAGMALPDAIQVREITDAGGAGLVDSLGMTLYALGRQRGAFRPVMRRRRRLCTPLGSPRGAANRQCHGRLLGDSA